MIFADFKNAPENFGGICFMDSFDVFCLEFSVGVILILKSFSLT